MIKTLVNVNLDYNPLGCAGVSALSRGLRSNKTLKVLSLRYCNIDEGGGEPLSEILSVPKIAITCLDLTGNRLGGKGLRSLCPGIKANSSLLKLILSDNNIMSSEADAIAIEEFSEVIREHKSITEISLLYNAIGEQGGVTLINGIGSNKRITSFTVDTSLPPDLYSALTRIPTKEKGKKKKGKKKKK